MRLLHRCLATRVPLLVAITLLFISVSAARSAVVAPLRYARLSIEMVLRDPQVIRRVSAWGLSMSDIRHDLSTLSPAERLQLTDVLLRPWHGSKNDSQAALQAQFLVMMSLMRESTLFASIPSRGSSRLPR